MVNSFENLSSLEIPNKFSVMRIWAVEDMGKNSVSPSTMPMMID
jgi:hypothetical protein